MSTLLTLLLPTLITKMRPQLSTLPYSTLGYGSPSLLNQFINSSQPPCPPTHSPAHPLTHPLTHILTHSLTHSPTHPLTHSLTYSPTHSLTHSPTHPLTHSPTHPLTHPPTHSLIHSLTGRHVPIDSDYIFSLPSSSWRWLVGSYFRATLQLRNWRVVRRRPSFLPSFWVEHSGRFCYHVLVSGYRCYSVRDFARGRSVARQQGVGAQR